MGNNIWVVEDLPPGCKHIDCKWIFRKKMNVDGTIDKFKTQLVAQGIQQKHGVDHYDTCNNSKVNHNQAIEAIVTSFKLVIHQMDVKATFCMEIQKKKFT